MDGAFFTWGSPEPQRPSSILRTDTVQCSAVRLLLASNCHSLRQQLVFRPWWGPALARLSCTSPGNCSLRSAWRSIWLRRQIRCSQVPKSPQFKSLDFLYRAALLRGQTDNRDITYKRTALCDLESAVPPPPLPLTTACPSPSIPLLSPAIPRA